MQKRRVGEWIDPLSGAQFVLLLGLKTSRDELDHAVSQIKTVPRLDADLAVKVSVQLRMALSWKGHELHPIPRFMECAIKLERLTGRIFSISETLNNQNRRDGL